MLAPLRPEDKEQIDPQRGQLQEDAPAGEARVNPAERAMPTAPSAFPRNRSLPHERGVDLRGEGVVLKGRDLAEDVGQEQVDRGDGDGGQVLQEEADQPVVSALKQMAHTHSVLLPLATEQGESREASRFSSVSPRPETSWWRSR